MYSSRKLGKLLEDYVLSGIKHIWQGARLTSNSGACNGDGDILCPDIYFDCKNTSRASHTVSAVEWAKAKKQAAEWNKIPTVVVCNKDEEITVTMGFDDFVEILTICYGSKDAE